MIYVASSSIVLDSLTWKGDHAELMYRLADAVFGEELVEIIRWLEQAGEERHVVTR